MAGNLRPTAYHENHQVAAASEPPPPVQIDDLYEIEYARFFNYAKTLSPGPSSSLLRPLSKHKKLRQRGGTWLSSSASAQSLRLFGDLKDQHTVVLAVYLGQQIHIQKFAMRFLNSFEAQTFINSLKESLKDVKSIGRPSCDFRPKAFL